MISVLEEINNLRIKHNSFLWPGEDMGSASTAVVMI